MSLITPVFTNRVIHKVENNATIDDIFSTYAAWIEAVSLDGPGRIAYARALTKALLLGENHRHVSECGTYARATVTYAFLLELIAWARRTWPDDDDYRTNLIEHLNHLIGMTQTERTKLGIKTTKKMITPTLCWMLGMGEKTAVNLDVVLGSGACDQPLQTLDDSAHLTSTTMTNLADVARTLTAENSSTGDVLIDIEPQPVGGTTIHPPKFFEAISATSKSVLNLIGCEKYTEDIWKMMCGGGAMLTLRGSTKSRLGKSAEPALLRTILLGLGLVENPNGGARTFRIGIPGDQNNPREVDAEVWVNTRTRIQIELGLIDPGNPEVIADKVSRIEQGGIVIYNLAPSGPMAQAISATAQAKHVQTIQMRHGNVMLELRRALVNKEPELNRHLTPVPQNNRAWLISLADDTSDDVFSKGKTSTPDA